MAKGAASKGENTRKVAGNAKKAAAAADKAAAEDAKLAAAETAKWTQGTKSTSKKEAEEAKKVDAARKKAEKDALLAEEEASARAKPKNNPKAGGAAKSRGLDLSQLDGADGSGKKGDAALNASGIDDALDALSLTTGGAAVEKVEKHPERRFKAAYKAFEERRLPELEEERPGLRKNQRVEICRKEFEKSPENPFNQVSVRFDASRDEIRDVKAEVRNGVERRLGTGG